MELVEALERVRKMIGTPIHITSGVRCKEHNKSLKNSSPDSSHLKGKAADIHIRDSVQRYKLVMLLGIYFNRLGIGSDFVHIDIDQDRAKKREVMWLY